MENTQPVTSTVNWMDKIKDTVQAWIKKMDLNSYKALEIGSYFAIGFFFGFLLKRHARIIFASILVLTIAIIILTYFDLTFINWSKVRELTNISPNDTLGTLIQNCINWLKQNIILIIGALVGILLGYKIG